MTDETVFGSSASRPAALITGGMRGIGLATVRHLLDRGAEAIAAYDKVIALDPKMASAYNNLAVEYEKQKKLDKAKELYQKALKVDPTNSEATRNLKRLKESAASTKPS